MINASDIFFITSPAYIVSAAIVAVVITILFNVWKQTIIYTGLIFGIYFVHQFIFRAIDSNEPLRLLGQLVYFYTFLTIMWLTAKLRENK